MQLKNNLIFDDEVSGSLFRSMDLFLFGAFDNGDMPRPVIRVLSNALASE